MWTAAKIDLRLTSDQLSKFWMARHYFYLLMQKVDETIYGFVICLRETLRECRFPIAVLGKILLDRVIYGNKHRELVNKFLSKGKDFTLG